MVEKMSNVSAKAGTVDVLVFFGKKKQRGGGGGGSPQGHLTKADRTITLFLAFTKPPKNYSSTHHTYTDNNIDKTVVRPFSRNFSNSDGLVHIHIS